jgi:hypothetical protein
LVEAIERHLLIAALPPEQARSAELQGWFDLPCPQHWLVLRVHADRMPTVDAYQAQRLLGGRAADGTSRDGWAPAGYLCSWDVRGVRRSRDGRLEFAGSAATPTGYARRVWEAHRRGVLWELLEAAEVVSGSHREAGVGVPGRAQRGRRPPQRWEPLRVLDALGHALRGGARLAQGRNLVRGRTGVP